MNPYESPSAAAAQQPLRIDFRLISRAILMAAMWGWALFVWSSLPPMHPDGYIFWFVTASAVATIAYGWGCTMIAPLVSKWRDIDRKTIFYTVLRILPLVPPGLLAFALVSELFTDWWDGRL